MSIFFVAVLGCKIPELPPTEPKPPEQGAVIGLRDAAGQQITDGRGLLGGGDNADPDAQGFVYYLGVSPGRIQVAYDLEGAAITHGAPTVLPDTLAIWTTSPLLLSPVPLSDPTVAQLVSAPGLSLSIPASSAVVEDVPVTGPFSVGLQPLTPAQRDSTPGGLQALVDDDLLTGITFDWMAAARAWDGEGEDVSLVEDARMIVTVDIPEGKPWASSPPRLFVYNPGRTYWQDIGAAVVDEGGQSVSFEVSFFGWWALGQHVEQRACISGRAVDTDGAPIDGAEVRLYQDDSLHIDRVTTQGGAFCAAIDAGSSGEIAITSVGRDRSALYTGGRTVVAGDVGQCGACTDIGDVVLERWPDEDDDGAWSGPGGDCDDSDPGVNPNPTLGDGSYCGSAL